MSRRKRARKKNKVEKRERERERNACEICFQKVIPPTLSTSNPNAVSGVERCQSSNGRQNTLFTEKVCLYSSFIFVFCKPHKSLTPKMKKKKKKLASITRSTFSAVDFHSRDRILAAVGFRCFEMDEMLFEIVCQ